MVIQESVIDAKINVCIRHCISIRRFKTYEEKSEENLPGEFIGVELVMEQ